MYLPVQECVIAPLRPALARICGTQIVRSNAALEATEDGGLRAASFPGYLAEQRTLLPAFDHPRIWRNGHAIAYLQAPLLVLTPVLTTSALVFALIADFGQTPPRILDIERTEAAFTEAHLPGGAHERQAR